jgi:pimeloyl-ACP methyl ester carboxylesterase
MKRAALAALGLIAVLIAVGMTYEQIGRHRDRNRYPRIGRPVDIGGRTLNIYCSGEGGPSVIFEGAGHTAGYAWIDMQSQAAKFTRACWYDRAGFGWSDPGPSPRTLKAIARDLHALLRAAAVPPPHVLVGAAAGAFQVRVYNGMFPTEVAGAVLIHADDPDVSAHEPEFMKGGLASLPPAIQRLGCDVLRPLMLHVGLSRLMGNPGAGRPYGLAALTPAQRQELIFLSNNPAAQTEGEGCHVDEIMAEVRAAGDFGNRPLVVLSGSEPFRSPSPRYTKEVEALNDYWFHELQPRLAALSTRGRLVIERDVEKPKAVIEAVRSVVDQVRTQRP